MKRPKRFCIIFIICCASMAEWFKGVRFKPGLGKDPIAGSNPAGCTINFNVK